MLPLRAVAMPYSAERDASPLARSKSDPVFGSSLVTVVWANARLCFSADSHVLRFYRWVTTHRSKSASIARAPPPGREGTDRAAAAGTIRGCTCGGTCASTRASRPPFPRATLAPPTPRPRAASAAAEEARDIWHTCVRDTAAVVAAAAGAAAARRRLARRSRRR